MPAPAVYWSASGAGGVSATVDVDLGRQADPDHSLVIGYATGVGVSSAPAGFTLDFTVGPSSPLQFWYRLERTVGGEQTYTITNPAATLPSVWGMWETDLIDTVSPLDESDGTGTFHPTTGTTTLLAGPTPGLSGTLDTLNFAAHVYYNGSFGGTFGTWDSHTDGFTESQEAAIQIGAGFLDASFSLLAADAVAGPFSATATFSTDATRSATTDIFVSSIVSYRGISRDVPWNQGQAVIVG